MKNVNTNTSNIEEKLPEDTEALMPVLSLENLTILNDYLKQKSVFDVYVSNCQLSHSMHTSAVGRNR